MLMEALRNFYSEYFQGLCMSVLSCGGSQVVDYMAVQGSQRARYEANSRLILIGCGIWSP